MDRATFTLVVEILFYLVLCAGVVAQLKGKYKWHDRLQAPIVVLNIFFIIFVMIPTFRLVVVEQLPRGLSDIPTLVTTLHGLLGTVAQLLAIYMFLAGFKILPRKIGTLRYWMWTTFVFWTATVLVGIGVYLLFNTGDTSAGEAVAEHDADLVTEEVPAEPASEVTEEVMAEHDEEEIIDAQPAEEAATEEAVEEVVAEHDEEEALLEAEPTEEVIGEHDEEVIVEAEPTEEATVEPAEEVVTEHDADLAPAEGTMTDEGTDTMDDLIDEHAEEPVEVTEPEFSGETGVVVWEQLNPTSTETPGIRYEQGMQYSEATNQIYLFGGRDGSQVYNDVWALDFETLAWRQLALNSPTAPPARFSMAMIVDDAGQNLYISVGHTQGGGNFNDIWKLDLSTEIWEDLTPTAGTPPAERYGTPGGNIGGNLVLTHGFGGKRYDDTWQFNTHQWPVAKHHSGRRFAPTALSVCGYAQRRTAGDPRGMRLARRGLFFG